MTTERNDRKKKLTRLIALIVAGVMILSVIVAAVLSRIW